MAVVLGYGGLANTNGARDFSGKVEAAVVDVSRSRVRFFSAMVFVLLGGRV